MPPVVADGSHHAHPMDSSKQPVLRSQKLAGGNSNVQIAPYQALPVVSAPSGLITHHRAAALEVQDHPEMAEEVGVSGGCCPGAGPHWVACKAPTAAKLA
jgi:hypothetical protein